MNTPTVSELAALAATLNAAGRMTPDAAARAALAHWSAANALLYTEGVRAEVNAKEREATAAAQADLRAALKAVRPPASWPVKLDRALPCWLPKLKGRTGEAAALYRAYLAANVRFDSYMRKGRPQGVDFEAWPPPPKTDVDKLFARDRREAFDEREFWQTGEWFLQWYTRRHATEVAQARAAAGRLGGRPPKKAKARKAEARTSGNRKKL